MTWSNKVIDAPSGLSAVSHRTMPAMVYHAGACLVSTITRSPTFNLPTSAECLSMTTSVLLRGGYPPGSRRYGFMLDTSFHAWPRVGAPAPGLPIALPFLPTNCA